MTRIAFGAVMAAMMCATATAHAESLVSEVRVAVLDHDTDLVGNSREGGLDIGLEALSQPLTQLDFIGAPRVVVGALANTEGYTNQIYAGLVAQWDFAHGLVRPDDALFLEGMVGGAWHDGKRDVRGTPEEADWKSHGSAFLFRTGFAVGYRLDEAWSLSLGFHHISNANFASPNQGANDVGLRVGRRF